jgi:hypothetical protein
MTERKSRFITVSNHQIKRLYTPKILKTSTTSATWAPPANTPSPAASTPLCTAGDSGP